MQRTVFYVLGSIVFVILVLRAIYVPLVHDEVSTFYYYIQSFEFNPLNGAHADANNHILNSFLTGLSYKYLGYSWFNLRLPNLLFFLPYLYFTWKIGTHFKTNLVKWTYLLASIGSVYFIQFFALSRGYGMSMAFLTAALYFVLQCFDKFNLKNNIGLSIALILAVFSNLTLLPTALILLGIILLLIIKNLKSILEQKSFMLKLSLNYVFTLGVIGIVLYISLLMRENGSLYYGSLDNFWNTTIKSLLFLLFENDSNTIQLIFGFFLVVFTILVVNYLRTKPLNVLSKESGLLLIFLLVLLSIAAMRYVLQINYPSDRVGLYLIPLFVLTFCYLSDQVKGFLKFASIPMLILPIHFLFALNFSHASIWNKEYIPDSFYNTIASASKKMDYPPTVGADALQIFTYNEKVFRKNSTQNHLQNWNKTIFDTTDWSLNIKQHPAKYHDFIISHRKYMKDISHLFDSISVAPISNLVLYKRKKPSVRNKITEEKLELNTQFNYEFVEVLNLELDSVETSSLYVGVNLELQALRHPFKSRVVAQVKNATTNDIIDYQYMQLNWLEGQTLKSKPIKRAILLNNIPPQEKLEVLVYIWNIEQKPFSVYESKIELFTLKDKYQQDN